MDFTSIEKNMEREKTEINYGNGFINVYLPREDGINHGDVAAPSPIFTLDNIYKFSDQVLNDRHLFIGKKTIHHTKFDYDDLDSSVLNSGRSSALGDKDSNIKTIKLSLDASQPGRNIRNRRRFNERLSAYVSNNRKPSDNVKLKEYSKSARTPRSVRDVKVEKPKKNLLTPVLKLGKPGRGASFENAVKSDSVELPPLQTSRTSLTRQKSYFGKEDTFWFPSSALRGIEQKPLKHLPMRPSSRQFNVWRQSTELLLDCQVDRFSPARMSWPNHLQNDVMITHKTFV